jgi:hypothetical protein
MANNPCAFLLQEPSGTSVSNRMVYYGCINVRQRLCQTILEREIADGKFYTEITYPRFLRVQFQTTLDNAFKYTGQKFGC